MLPRPLWLCCLAALLPACSTPMAYREVHPPRALPARAEGEKILLRVDTPTGERLFTLRQLEALRAVEYRTEHPQLNKTFAYQGVLLSDLAKEVGLQGRDLRLEAVNNYGSTIARRDYEDYPVLLAYRADGEPISMQNKGPLTVVFPTHAYARRFPELKYGAQWVWYVNKVRTP